MNRAALESWKKRQEKEKKRKEKKKKKGKKEKKGRLMRSFPVDRPRL